MVELHVQQILGDFQSVLVNLQPQPSEKIFSQRVTLEAFFADFSSEDLEAKLGQRKNGSCRGEAY